MRNIPFCIHIYEKFALIRVSYAIIRESFALIREVTLKFAIVLRLFSNSLIFYPYENELNGLSFELYK